MEKHNDRYLPKMLALSWDGFSVARKATAIREQEHSSFVEQYHNWAAIEKPEDANEARQVSVSK
jgi:hypothetical protein